MYNNKDMNLSYKKCKYSNYVNENKLKLKIIEFHNLFKKQYNTDRRNWFF